MNKITTLIVSVFLLLSAGTALAAPSTSGQTGLINDPSADTLRAGQIGMGYYHLQNGGAGVLSLGLTSRLEAGVSGFRLDGERNRTYVSGKYSLLPETILTPGLAVGMEDIAGQQERSSYVVASKSLPFGFRLHAGYGNGRFGGGFGAIEKTLNPIGLITGSNVFPATTLIAEYDGKTFNYGARVAIVPGLKFDAGRRDHGWYVGVNFTQ